MIRAERLVVSPFFCVVLLLLASCGGSSGSESSTGNSNNPPSSNPPNNSPQEFFCRKDSSCPEISIASDSHSTRNGQPSPFRGYGDPSLIYDEDTDMLWMTYSWLNLLDNAGLPGHVNLGVQTHLASSDDGGATFEYVSDINEANVITHPDPSNTNSGWLIRETSSIIEQADGMWQALWLQYFSPVPDTPSVQSERSDFLFANTIATSPSLLGLTSSAKASGNFTSPSFGPFINLTEVQDSSGNMPLSDCTAFTEPDLFAHNNETFLIAQCLVFAGGSRAVESERLFLLREQGSSYQFISNLTEHSDAQQFSADVLTQPDVSVARDDSVILLVTPKTLGADPEHQGCVALVFDDFAAGTLSRDTNNALVERAIITAEGNGIGPGLCTYDANSETGVLLVITTEDSSGTEFSLRRTGIHP